MRTKAEIKEGLRKAKLDPAAQMEKVLLEAAVELLLDLRSLYVDQAVILLSMKKEIQYLQGRS